MGNRSGEGGVYSKGGCFDNAKSLYIEQHGRPLASQFPDYFFLKHRPTLIPLAREKRRKDDFGDMTGGWRLAPQPTLLCISQAESISAAGRPPSNPFYWLIGQVKAPFMTVIISHRITFYQNLTTQNRIDTLKMSINWCPVVRPTSKEFKNFYQYMEYLDKTYRKDYGMVKIVPPPEWRARQSDYGPSVDNMMVPGPIEQNTYGKGGIYECLHIQKKSLTYREYRKKTEPFDKIAEGKDPEEVEDLFWKNIAFSPPLYGADVTNTLMESCAGPWNLGKLESVLSHALETPIKGVNTPYCYVGSWKTLFCWHTEDLQLSAINYLHDGKPKFWYSIPPSQSHIIEKQANKLFSEQFSKCPQYLRHKTTVINPYLLKQKYPELKLSKMQHCKGEFIAVFGGSYHCGFNLGFNLAEAVNYATLSWLKKLPHCQSCKCANDSVKVLNTAVLQNLQNSPLKTTKQVLELRRQLHSELQQDSDTAQNDSIRKVFRKRIQKGSAKKTLTYKGEKYQIDRWVQCDSCNKWRRTHRKMAPKERFTCELVGVSCKVREERDEEFITI